MVFIVGVMFTLIFRAMRAMFIPLTMGRGGRGFLMCMPGLRYLGRSCGCCRKRKTCEQNSCQCLVHIDHSCYLFVGVGEGIAEFIRRPDCWSTSVSASRVCVANSMPERRLSAR